LGVGLADKLSATRDSVAWQDDGPDVDVLRFEDLVARDTAEALGEAETLYRGALLDGLEISEPAFEQWLAGERARLEAMACQALMRLAVLRFERRDTARGIEAARRLLRIDPLREDGHRLLMRGLVADGRRSEALRHFDELEDLLNCELGVAPDSKTKGLRDTILQDKDERRPSVAVVAPVVPSDNDETGTKLAANPPRSTRRRGIIAAAVAALAVGALVVWSFYPRGPAPLTEVASEAKMAFPLPDKPSLAVLPFVNLSNDPQQGFLADGLTEDLITALSRVPQLFVIARTSVAGYKDQPVKVQSVAEDLGVRYVLEGSVQKSGEKLRITAQLIDALSGHHLWGGRFDRPAKEIFALQDEIVRQILIELQVQLTAGDNARIASRGTRNLEAWLLRVQGLHEGLKFTREGMARAREFLEAAHETDPDWARPLAGIAWIEWYEALRGWSAPKHEAIERGVDLAQRAIVMDPEGPLGYMQLGNLMALKGDYESGLELREKAVALAPNDFLANWGLGAMLMWVGQPQRALDVFERARRVSPHHPPSFTLALGQAQYLAGRYDDALDSLSQVVERAPAWASPRVLRVIVYGDLGRQREARTEAAEILRLKPDFTVSGWMKSSMFEDTALRSKHAGLLREAGLRE
jgi:TolB-like protein